MSSGRCELNKLLSSNQPISFYYWISLLNIFTEFQTELDIDTMRLLVAECEQCRLELNDKTQDKIEKADVRPEIYKHLDKLEASYKNNYNKESLPTNLVAVAQ